MPKFSAPVAKYDYRPEKRDWLGLVACTDGKTVKVLTTGIEYSEADIKAWLRLALKNRPWDPDGTPAPDAVDRAKANPH